MALMLDIWGAPVIWPGSRRAHGAKLRIVGACLEAVADLQQ